MKYLNPLLSMLVGLVIVCLAWQRLQVKETYIPSSALVTDIVTKDSSLFQIYISINPKRHETHRLSFSLNSVPHFMIGDSIMVAYRANNMEDVRLLE